MGERSLLRQDGLITSRVGSPSPAVAAVLIAIAAVVAAAVTIGPDLVDRVLSGDQSPDVENSWVIADDAVVGNRLELRLSEVVGGGSGLCSFTRVVDDRGITDGEASCDANGRLRPWDAEGFTVRTTDQYFGSLDTVALGSVADGSAAVGVVGSVHPEVRRVLLRFGDNAEYSFVPRDAEGWFAVVLPDEVADIDRVSGMLVNNIVEVELRGGDGRVLGTVTDPARADAS